MIDAQSEHILSRSAIVLLAETPRSSPVSHSHRRKHSTWHSARNQRSPFGWSIFLKNVGVSLRGTMVVNVDSQGNIALAKNLVFYDRSKHVDIQYHFTRDLVKKQRIYLEYIPTKDMLADLLTKTLPHVQHEQLWHRFILVVSTYTRLVARGCVGNMFRRTD